ncbi:hypothetical protein P3S67_012580 [Capsicum chacoense]
MWGVTNSDEVMHLFSWHAFQNPVPLEEYVEVAKGTVTYARGLPLALTVLGSSLFGLPIEEWRNTIEKLKRIPDDNIQEKLKISFDALPDDKVKAIFLDTACCLRGMDKDDAVTILDACDLFAEAGIQDLIDRCLLIISTSKFEEFKASLKLLRSLKSLNLNSCKNLMRTPNFTGASSLKRLSFENCSSLTEVQSSIGDLNKLKELNLLWCIKLEKLPSSISNLKSLDTLILNWCVTLQQLPDDLGNLQSLKKFSAPRTAVTYLLSSFGRLKKLEYMHMGGFGRSVPSMTGQEPIGFLPSSIKNLCSLNKLCLASCDLSEEDIPT